MYTILGYNYPINLKGAIFYMYETLLQEMTGLRLFYEEEALLNKNESVQLHENIDMSTKSREDKIVKKNIVCDIYFNSELENNLQPEQFMITVEEKGNKKSFILKRKNYVGKYGNETTTKLSKKQYMNILNGSLDWMKDSSKVLLNEFYCKIKLFHYKISKIIKCYREEIYLKCQQLLITIDEDIKPYFNGSGLIETEPYEQKAYVRIRSTQNQLKKNEDGTLLEELLK